MTSNIRSEEDARVFVANNKRENIKLRINMTDYEGLEFEYRDYEPIIEGYTADQMFQLLEDYKQYMPNLKAIMQVVLGDVGRIDNNDAENIVETLMTHLEDDLKQDGYRGSELEEMMDILDDLARDLYNYITFALVESKLIENDLVWEFLKCTEAYYSSGKIYATVRIYVEQLKDLDQFNDQFGLDYVEIVDELSKLLVSYVTHVSGWTTRDLVDGPGPGKLTDGLVA